MSAESPFRNEVTWRDYAKYVAAELGRVLFPPRPPCPGCHQPRRRPSGGLCIECHRRITKVTAPLCDRCGRPLRGKGPPICLACREGVRFFDAARAPAVYSDAMRTYVRRFKYGGERQIGHALGLMMTAHAVQKPVLWPIDVVVPMPLHRTRLEQRGFNQAELLGRTVASGIGRRLESGALRRIKATTKQSLLPGGARWDNVKDAFVVSRPAAVAGRRILLIDDVLTSGATADEAARTLLRAGAARVTVLCAAVAIHDYDWRKRHMAGATSMQ